MSTKPTPGISLIVLGVLVFFAVMTGCKDDGAASETPELPPVVLEGWGLRLDLAHPFKIAPAPVGPNGQAGQLMLSWKVGERIASVVIAPAPVPTGEAGIEETTDMPGFRVGASGTRVVVPPQTSEIAKVVPPTKGPPTEAFWIVGKGNREKVKDRRCESSPSLWGFTCAKSETNR